MSEDDAFLRAILDEPHDDALPLIYADWLEERGDLRGEYLRLLCAVHDQVNSDQGLDPHLNRLLELRRRIDPWWLAQIRDGFRRRMKTHSAPVYVLFSEKFLGASPVRQLLDAVLLQAIVEQAREVRFEPEENLYVMRYQVDDAWYDLPPPPVHLGSAISQIFKVIAELDICNSRTVQTGKVRLEKGAKFLREVGVCSRDAEITIQPTPHGESIFVKFDV